MPASDLTTMFAPARVAVIGATDRQRSVGAALMRNLSTFDGEVAPVNPNRSTVFGKDCYPTIEAVPRAASIEVAIVVVPAAATIEVVEQIGAVGIENVVVITSGFSETDEAGAQRERELIEVAETYDLNLVGPNCVGFVSTPGEVNATFLQASPPVGSMSLLSQSGAFIAAVIGWATHQGIGFRHVVSLGNEAVLDEVDFIDALGEDLETEVIVAYLEDIDDGRRFIDTARSVTDQTPIVVLKSGRTAAGAEAASSHTGSLAGSDQAYDAGFTQAGVLRARSLQEVFDIGRALAGQPPPDHDATAVVTNGGGPGVLTADAIGDSQLTLAEFGPETTDELADRLPTQADVTNPLDIIGDADLDRFRGALDVVLRSDAVGGAVVLCVPTALLEFEELAAAIQELRDRYGTPVVTCLMGGEEAGRAAEFLQSHGIPNYFDPSRAVTGLEALVEYRAITDRVYESPAAFDVDRERARAILERAFGNDTNRLGSEAMELVAAYGIPVPAGAVTETLEEAEAVATDLGEPVVMKLVSPDVIHKSDIGGVEVGVPLERVGDTYQTLRERALEYDPDADIIGVYVQELVDLEASTETIVGVKRDPQFGHLLMFGLGGIFVEIFEDTSFRVAPVSERDAREMTADIQAAPMLRGARGRTPADIDAIVETIQRISQLVTDFPAITELDINPLVAAPDGVCAIDLRATVDRESWLVDR